MTITPESTIQDIIDRIPDVGANNAKSDAQEAYDAIKSEFDSDSEVGPGLGAYLNGLGVSIFARSVLLKYGSDDLSDEERQIVVEGLIYASVRALEFSTVATLQKATAEALRASLEDEALSVLVEMAFSGPPVDSSDIF